MLHPDRAAMRLAVCCASCGKCHHGPSHGSSSWVVYSASFKILQAVVKRGVEAGEPGKHVTLLDPDDVTASVM